MRPKVSFILDLQHCGLGLQPMPDAMPLRPDVATQVLGK
jgi:hypothetical protein